jgi:hypothetical protein
MIDFLWEKVQAQRGQIAELEAKLKAALAVIEGLIGNEILSDLTGLWEAGNKLIHPEDYKDPPPEG